jgi:acetyltransferase-like isoleucine patch superfamily enzyme
MRLLLKLFITLLPWPLRRRLLNRCFGYAIDAEARIGLAWVYPTRLVMAAGSRIGHLTVAVNLDRIELGPNSSIHRNNWITGYPKNRPPHFGHLPERDPALILGEESAITKHHHIDCTDSIRIGKFTTIAGYSSQFLTHSIDIENNRQDARPIEIGDYAFVGTNCVILGGAVLPSYSVLGAKSLLNRSFDQSHQLYGGVPAKALKAIPPESAYFHRTKGFVT